MSWTQALEEFVGSASIDKGRAYFDSGVVSVRQSTNGSLTATVTAGNQYLVTLDLKKAEETIVVGCTCKYYENSNICKHIWAALLAAESGGHFPQLRQAKAPFIETQLEYYEFVGEVQSRPNFIEKPKNVETWESHLSNLRASTPGHQSVKREGRRDVIYVADVQKSITAGCLVVQAAVRRLRKDGSFGKPTFQETSIREVSKLDPIDRRLLGLLSGSRETHSSGYREPDSARAIHQMTPALVEDVIPMLVETGRFFLKPVTPPDALLPMKWDQEAVWRLKITIEPVATRQRYVAKGFLTHNENRRALAEPLLIVPGLAFFDNHVARFDAADAFEWVSMFRKVGELAIPFDDIGRFMEQMAQFPLLPPMDVPKELRIEARPLVNPPRIHIRPLNDSGGSIMKLGAVVTFDYGGTLVPETVESSTVHDAVANRPFKRDKQAELALRNRLPDLGFRPMGSWQQVRWELSPSRLPEAVRALVAEGWHVDAEGKLYRRSGSFQMKVTSGVDWFELQGYAEFENQRVEMPQLLKAIARGETSVRLGDGSYGLVPEEWLKRYRLVATIGKFAGKSAGASNDEQFRFERHHVGFLDALLAEQPEVTFDDAFARLREQLTTFSGIQAATPTNRFHGQLREYQREGLGWLLFLRRFGFGGCLADDMGLGKTVQVLALLASVESKRPTLIVAPRSLIFNWKQESERFAPELRVLDHTGVERQTRWQELHDYNVILTTYGTLRRDIHIFKDIHFDTVILDEAQAIKNAGTESAKATRLLKADHKLALTGTPVENRVDDLWSLFEFLNPGLLGSASIFRMQENSLQILSKALRPFLLRRTKGQVALELPPKTEQTIYCELETEQRRLYDELRGHYRNALLGRIDEVGIEKSRMHILEALLRLRQAACHPGLIDKTRAHNSSAKLDSLIPQIRELLDERHKTLVFSQFTSLLEILRKRLDSEHIVYEYLDGRTRDRGECVRRFQEDDECRLFLISLKAGGLGLNLTAAEYVFLLDPWWNPAIEAQAIDRSHRIGQTRRVFAYRMIARDTVEEKILDLQKTKRDLADAIITEDNGVLSSLNRENLELLLS